MKINENVKNFEVALLISPQSFEGEEGGKNILNKSSYTNKRGIIWQKTC